MTPTYLSMQVDEPGAAFHPVEQIVSEPGPGHVRVSVEAVGICHSDSMFIDGHMPGVSFPLVAGHEIAGRIDAIGDEVEGFKIGQRVAVGWFGGNCGHCVACREGDAINCAHLQIPGLSYPAGSPRRSSSPPRPWRVYPMSSLRRRQPDGLRRRVNFQRAASQRRSPR
jgi:alcohol dehydrogenase